MTLSISIEAQAIQQEIYPLSHTTNSGDLTQCPSLLEQFVTPLHLCHGVLQQRGGIVVVPADFRTAEMWTPGKMLEFRTFRIDQEQTQLVGRIMVCQTSQDGVECL